MINKGIDFGDIHVPRLEGNSMDEEEYIEDEELEKGSDLDRVRAILAGEGEGIDEIDQLIEMATDPQLKEMAEAIKQDESKHKAALEQWLETQDEGGSDEPGPEDTPDPDEGEEEQNSVFCGGRNGRKRYKSVHSPEAARYARHCGLQCHHDPRNGRRYSRRLRKNRASAKGLGYKKQNEDHRTDARCPVREHTSEPLRRPVIQRRAGVLFKKQSGEREAGKGDSTGYPLAYPASESARRQAHWH